MEESYNLENILSAIEDIHTKPPKKKTIIDSKKKIPELITPKLESSGILSITEQIIRQAEEYSKNKKEVFIKKNSLLEDVLILDREYTDHNLKIIDLEEVKLNIIDDLYSSLSKKVKKKTIKTIFDLREKINILEKEVKILNFSKVDENFDTDNDRNLEKNEEHLINEDNLNINENDTLDKKKKFLTRDVIETLKLQESLIKNFEKNEEKLRLKIVDLEQDKNLLNTK